MKTTGLNFIEAVQAAMDGTSIRRRGWRECVNIHLDKRGVFDYVDGCMATLTKEDYLATDWEIIVEPPKTMTFQEAVEHIEAGKKVRRLAWQKDWHARLLKGVPGVAAIFGDSVIANPFTTDDYKATDWIAVEEENQ